VPDILYRGNIILDITSRDELLNCIQEILEIFYSNLTVEELLADLQNQLENSLAIPHGATILTGVSGGPDSMALLHALSRTSLQLKIQALYIDHCLRPAETPVEKVLIESYCQEWAIPFFSATVDVPLYKSQTGCSPEEAARKLRYEVFAEFKQKLEADFIAVAHTADDQVEEFFLRLNRGTGLTGLSGMKARNGHIIRPFLPYTKKQLLQYLHTSNISFCQDSSNLDRKFLRNRIRLDLLPLLEEQFLPDIKRKILQTMEILQAEDDFLTAESDKQFKLCVTAQHEGLLLDTTRFSNAHRAIQRRILEQCCIDIQSSPSFQVITSLQEQICSRNLPRELHLPNGGRVISFRSDLLFLRVHLRDKRAKVPTAPPIFLEIGEPCIVEVPGTSSQLSLLEQEREGITKNNTQPSDLLVDRDKIEFPLVLRSSEPGERFTPFKSNGSKKISRYLNEKKIPAREKNLWPVLVSRKEPEKIISIPGLAVAEGFQPGERTKNVLIIRLQKPFPVSS